MNRKFLLVIVANLLILAISIGIIQSTGSSDWKYWEDGGWHHWGDNVVTVYPENANHRHLQIFTQVVYTWNYAIQRYSPDFGVRSPKTRLEIVDNENADVKVTFMSLDRVHETIGMSIGPLDGTVKGGTYIESAGLIENHVWTVVDNNAENEELKTILGHELGISLGIEETTDARYSEDLMYGKYPRNGSFPGPSNFDVHIVLRAFGYIDKGEEFSGEYEVQPWLEWFSPKSWKGEVIDNAINR